MRPVKRPDVKTFKLTQWDPSGETTVTVSEHREAQSRVRNTLWDRKVLEWEEGGRLRREYYEETMAKLIPLECWLTFVDADIWGIVDDDDEPHRMFWPDMKEQEFFSSFGQLDDALVLEWHDCVLTLNPEWEPE